MPLAALCNGIVGLYKEAFGRGPTKARAHFVGPDLVLIVLEHTLTVAERNLVALGEDQRLRELRLISDYTLEEGLRAIVERILGRRTMAFVTGIDVRRDVSAALVTLEPSGKEPAGFG